MTSVAKASLPVTTVEIQGNESEPRITSADLALWFGDPADTPASTDALLNGWTVRGDKATRGHHVLRIVSMPSGSHALYVEEPTLTAAQLTALKPFGWPMPGASSAVTIEIPIIPTVSGSALSPGISALLHALAQTGSTPATLYWATVPSPAPTHYESYAGPVSPTVPVAPRRGGGQYSCDTGDSTVVGLSHGLLVPRSVAAISNANGITAGFAAGVFVVSSNHAGTYQNYWYRIPSVTVSPRY